MDISTLTPDKQVKLQYWLDVIRQCRASGLTNQVWCEQHDISLKSYYYWIAKIRKLALEEPPRKSHGCRPVMFSFAGVLTSCGFDTRSYSGSDNRAAAFFAAAP